MRGGTRRGDRRYTRMPDKELAGYLQMIPHRALCTVFFYASRGSMFFPFTCCIIMSAPHSFSAIVSAPFGAIGIKADASHITELVYLPPSFEAQEATQPLAARAAQQVAAYLQDPEYRFDLPLQPRGTAFQQRVWQAICAIPPGKLQTYGQMARELHSAPRAVGQACGANWFPLIIPCHRVTAANGLGGFAHATGGFLLDTKRWLLAHEKALLFA